jgi:hypothetical protein
MGKRKVIRLEVNEPVILRFNFSEPIPSEGKFGMQFYYGVMKEGDSQYYGFYATENLNRMLQSLENIKERKIEIEKKVYPEGKHYWVLREDGEDITPKLNSSLQAKSEKESEEASKLEDFEIRLKKIETYLFD